MQLKNKTKTKTYSELSALDRAPSKTHPSIQFPTHSIPSLICSVCLATGALDAPGWTCLFHDLMQQAATSGINQTPDDQQSVTSGAGSAAESSGCVWQPAAIRPTWVEVPVLPEGLRCYGRNLPELADVDKMVLVLPDLRFFLPHAGYFSHLYPVPHTTLSI